MGTSLRIEAHEEVANDVVTRALLLFVVSGGAVGHIDNSMGLFVGIISPTYDLST